ncbi:MULTISPECIES: RRQRL motif-containing zinc-binding protein [Streptomyces]|uniref:RRQRL motif-containing zinc-binding protein n=1 Tax=Streptomyces galilaeus TaxID=33899 RepID=A0ABW9IYK5_STRGJ|nr:RRQRL motif-containing zinc-binding protein [Streptomyces galilaeus]
MHGSKWREQEKEWAAGIAVASIGVGAGDLVDVDPYDGGRLPEYRWRQAPEGLATRRQLRAMGLRPGGHDPVAQMTCRSGKRVAYLYRVDLAVTKLPMTLAKEAALDKAMAARQTCPRCRRRYVACLPLTTLESCLECHDGSPADPSSYTTPPAKHLLAA